MKNLRVVVADEQAIFRAGLTILINAQPDMHVVGEAPTAQDAIAQVETLQPDVVLMEASLAQGSGVQATTYLSRACPATRVIVLTAYAEGEHMRQILRAGAAGYLLKGVTVDALIHAVRVVVTGGLYLDPMVANHVVQHYLSPGPPADVVEPESLSERETVVLRLLAWGHNHKEIAVQLGLSTKTVETYKARLMRQLRLLNRVDIVRYAVQQGWMSGL